MLASETSERSNTAQPGMVLEAKEPSWSMCQDILIQRVSVLHATNWRSGWVQSCGKHAAAFSMKDRRLNQQLGFLHDHLWRKLDDTKCGGWVHLRDYKRTPAAGGRHGQTLGVAHVRASIAHWVAEAEGACTGSRHWQ
ncbi:unnamed protein product [Durusdinium trenchii]|uniref:Uncharacterized protein n=2 Tax=Durusdinium trenchii TaxID=1381693 RepID=A0ABP0QPM2_9DINO